jgi:uncharacterized repeat protein (TIGR04076 family)
MNDSFNLFNLEVTVVGDPAMFICSHKVGHAFSVVGENIVFNDTNDCFSLYSLSAILPLLPSKQRPAVKNDWITSEAEMVACPDPHCGARFKITRTTRKTFKHSKITKVPINNDSRS